MTSGKSYLNWFKEAGRGHIAAVLSWGAYGILFGSFILRLQFDLMYTFFGIGSNSLLFFICTGLGVVLGLLEFSYLLQERKQDFYFSLPVKKATIFYTHYLHGIFHGVLPMICYMLICGIYQSSVDPVFMEYSVGYTFHSILAYGVTFLVFYHITIFAVEICGQAAAVICMLGVFMYSMQLFLNSVCLVFMKSFYETFYRSPILEILENILIPWKLGKILTRQEMYEKFQLLEIKPEAVILIAGLIWIVLFFILTVGVMKYRKAERVGCIFTIPTAGNITEILLGVLAGTGIGAMLLAVSRIAEMTRILAILIMITTGILAVFIVHFLFEHLVYDKRNTENGRGTEKKWYRLALECILAAGIVAVLTGKSEAYDSYLPKTEEVKSLGIAMAGIDMDAGDYSSMMRERDSYLVDDLIERYTMKADGKEIGMQWLRMLQAESETAAVGEKSAEQSRDEAFTSEWKNRDAEDRKEREKQIKQTKVTVCFEKKNGRKIYRTYDVPEESLLAFADVYETEEYKKAAYPLIAENEEITKGARFVWDDGVEQQTLKLTDAEKAEFLILYRRDISELKMTDLQETFPSGSLEIGSEIYDRAIRAMIYPSFENVTTFLKEHGVDPAKEVGDYPIEGLTVWETHSVPENSVGGVYMHRYETEEELAEWKGKLIPEEFCIQPVLCPVDGTYTAEVDVTEVESGALISVDCNVKSGK